MNMLNAVSNDFSFIIIELQELETIKQINGDLFSFKLVETIISKISDEFSISIGGILKPMSDMIMFDLDYCIQESELARQIDLVEYAVNNTLCLAKGVLSIKCGASVSQLGSTKDQVKYNAKIALSKARQSCTFKTVVRLANKKSVCLKKPMIMNAIDKCDFIYVIQPVFDLNSGICVGGELLLRWRIGEKTINPIETFEIIKKTGTLKPVTFYLIKLYISSLTRLIKHGFEGQLAFNLSPHQLEIDGVASLLIELIKATNIKPETVVIEVTEDENLTKFEQARKSISLLKEYGCNVSLDDFGSGFANFQLIDSQLYTCIKVDKSHTANLQSSSISRTIISSALSIANAAGVNCILEGIETIEQRNIAQSLGFQFGQGYLLSKPIELEQFINEYVG